MLFISLILVVLVIVIYGVNVFEIFYLGIVGLDCMSLIKYKLYFKIYSGVLLLFLICVFVMCIIVYIFVGKVLYRQMQFWKKVQFCRNKFNVLLLIFFNVYCLIVKLINGFVVFFDKIEIEEDLLSINNDYLRVNKNNFGNNFGL